MLPSKSQEFSAVWIARAGQQSFSKSRRSTSLFRFFFFPRFCCSTLCHIILHLATGTEWLSRARILPSWLLLDWKQREKKACDSKDIISSVLIVLGILLVLCVISFHLKLLEGNLEGSHTRSYRSSDLQSLWSAGGGGRARTPQCASQELHSERTADFFWKAGNKAIASFSLLSFWCMYKHLINIFLHEDGFRSFLRYSWVHCICLKAKPPWKLWSWKQNFR